MSPPIRDGSGNSIGSIRLGDGSEISEVRTGAGDVLFSGILDSVVNRVPFDDGSGGTATASVGSADITLNNGGTWTSNPAFKGGTAAIYDQTDDGPSNWTPRSSLPITYTIRVRADADGLTGSNPANVIFRQDGGTRPELFYRTDNENWQLRDSNSSAKISQPQSTLEGSIQILAARIDTSTLALDIYEADAVTKVASDKAGSSTTDSDLTSQLELAGTGGDTGWGDALDLIDVHDTFLSDSKLDSIVSEVYG